VKSGSLVKAMCTAVLLLLRYAWCRLSKLPLKEHRLVREDPRFLQLVGLAKGKLQSRPKELRGQQLGNMINGKGTKSSVLTRGSD
jgi:hypothetical protein